MAKADPEAPASVLDASALLAHLNDEEGAAAVREAMEAGAAITGVNWAEVLTKLAEKGGGPRGRRRRDEGRGADRRGGHDRACIALAGRLGVPAVTADREWGKAAVGAKVQVIR